MGPYCGTNWRCTAAFHFLQGLEASETQRTSCTGWGFLSSSHWWGGGLPREGVVAEKFVPSLESLSSLAFEDRNLGCPGNFAGMSGTLGDVGQKKVCAHFSCPIHRVLQGAP